MTVGELLARISSRELSEWIVYFEMEPFGEERADLRAGIVAATVANTARDTKRRVRPLEPKEFMPVFERERPRQSWQEQLEIVRMLNAAAGGEEN